MHMDKSNFFYKYQNNPEYKKLFKQEKELLAIALAITEERKKKRLTQLQLAKRTGMPQSQIARIESGNTNITIGTLNRVVSALGLRVKVSTS